MKTKSHKEKDIVEKTLLSYNDVFADIVNVLLFGGKEVVKEEELVDGEINSMYKADGKLRQQERDVSKYWGKNKIQMALFGIENQSAVDKTMPLRILGYDGASYRNQLNQQSEEFYPVITLVLYFGKGKWKRPNCLFDCIKVSEELKPFVTNYKINVFSVREFTETQISLFKSDFKIVADYFVKSKKNPAYKGSKDEIKHVDEFFNLMRVFTHDNRFEVLYNESEEIEISGGNNMDSFLDTVEKRGYDKGISTGIMQTAMLTAKNLLKRGKLTTEEIAEDANLPLEKVEELARELNK